MDFILLLGENNAVLTEAYYSDYYKIQNKDFTQKMRNYYDFIVAYEELLFDSELIDNTMTYTGGINEEYIFEGSDFSVKAEANKVWTQVKGNRKI